MDTKKCAKCREIKNIDSFNKSKHSKDGCQSKCRECEREYYKNNKSKINARNKEWSKKNPEKRAEIQRRFHERNPEALNQSQQKYKKNNPEAVAKAQKKWKDNNKDKVKAKKARRRAAKLQATPSWANKKMIYDVYLQASLLNLQVDHIVPLKSDFVCGLHCEANLQLLTRFDNLKKGNRYWPDMW